MYFGFQNITVAYGEKTVLRNFTMEVPRGSITALIGANGCGKSSLLRTVVRMVKPVSGFPVYEDRPLLALPQKAAARKIAYLPQNSSAPTDMDVRTLVLCGRYPYQKFGRGRTYADIGAAEHAMTLTGIAHLADRPLGQLSGGELQRARIAMTVAGEPEILLLDEPTTSLDIGYQMEILELIARLNRESGMTVLAVLHDLNLAARYAHRLCAIREGSLFCEGSPDEVLTADTLRALYSVDAVIHRDETHGCPYFIPS